MKNTLVDMMSNYIDLTDEEREGILASFPVITHPKDTVLLKEGEVAKSSYLVIKGCVRKYLIKKGDELTSEFYTEMEPVVDFESLYHRRPSKYYYTCIEDSVIAELNAEKEAELYKRFPRFGEVCRVEMEKMLGSSQEKLSDFKNSTPTERYLMLLQERPNLVNRVPQYQLASYLGIKPETLSRIRKRISIQA